MRSLIGGPAMVVITGWVEELNAYGLRVGPHWVPWAIGATPRPCEGEYAEVIVDAEGYAVDVIVRAWRPRVPSAN
jgi:hypothetical protein